jgi:hypothetical protein
MTDNERLIVAIEQLTAALSALHAPLVTIAEQMKTPSPGWRRMLDEFRGAVARMPTSVRMRP